MLRKVMLLLCIAITVFCYGWPSLVVPFGTYKGKVGDEAVSYEFSFNGTVVYKTSEETKNGKYELDFMHNAVKITLDGEETQVQTLKNMYEFDSFKNQIGQYVILGVGILAIVLVLISPNGNKD